MVAAGVREVIPTVIQTGWSLLLTLFCSTGRRVGGGEYNFARGVEFPFVPSPFLPASASSLSNPFFVFGVCTLGIENTNTQEDTLSDRID